MSKLFLLMALLFTVNISLAAEDMPEGDGNVPGENQENASDQENPCSNNKVACYGIADHGQNENVINPSIDGHVYGIGEAPPCHPEAYICLPEGTDCSKIIVAQDQKMNYVRGSGAPDFYRPQVDYCYPYDQFPGNGKKGHPTFPNPDWKREVERI